jgi:hypothetical protein
MSNSLTGAAIALAIVAALTGPAMAAEPVPFPVKASTEAELDAIIVARDKTEERFNALLAERKAEAEAAAAEAAAREERLEDLKKCPSHIVWDYRCRQHSRAVQTSKTSTCRTASQPSSKPSQRPSQSHRGEHRNRPKQQNGALAASAARGRMAVSCSPSAANEP